MPIIDITLLEGRPYEKKAALMREVSEVAVRTLGAPPESVRVIVREIPASHFAIAGVPKGSPTPAPEGSS